MERGKGTREASIGDLGNIRDDVAVIDLCSRKQFQGYELDEGTNANQAGEHMKMTKNQIHIYIIHTVLCISVPSPHSPPLPLSLPPFPQPFLFSTYKYRVDYDCN